jgi:hypothetical protein
VLEIEGRTALLWSGYELGLDTLALDMMHADFDLANSLLSQFLLPRIIPGWINRTRKIHKRRGRAR